MKALLIRTSRHVPASRTARRRRAAAGVAVATLITGALGASPAAEASSSATVVSGNVSLSSLTVPAGTTYELDPNRSTTVTLTGSLLVYGTLRMHPASPSVVHTVRFVGVNENAYVGGGALTPSDTGLWVEDSGQLDAVGSPKAGWNRTGTDRTWAPTDEYLAAPTAKGDFTADPYTLGSRVPSVTAPDGNVYSTEVANLTRNVRIEGTPGGRAHVRLHSLVPQTIKYVAFRYLGPRKDLDGNGFTDPIPGRTGLHLHRQDGASRGTLIEGVVLRDIGGETALDVHRDDGVTVRDSLVVRANGDGFGWQMNELEPSNDNVFDHDLTLDLEPVPVYRGFTQAGFQLGNGTGNVVRDSAAAAGRGNVTASGFSFPEGTPQEVDPSWTSTSLVSHNNKADGFYAWQNSAAADADVTNIVSYRNGIGGVDHGAYANAFSYAGVMAFDNGSDLILHSKSNPEARRPLEFNGTFGTVLIPRHSSSSLRPSVVRGKVGSLVVSEDLRAGRGGRTDFIDTGLTRANVRVGTINPETVLRVRNGTDCWSVTAAGTRTIPCF